MDARVRTARSNGSVGKNAILPNHILSIPSLKYHLILDFGCGPAAIHVKMLRDNGFKFVFGKDLVPLENSEYEVACLLPWHLIYASNVLNVQTSFSDLQDTIREISELAELGVVYLNYPVSPRKLKLSVEEMHNILKNFFPAAFYFKLHNTPIFKCVGKNCQKKLEMILTV
jgi:hypothetical protein